MSAQAIGEAYKIVHKFINALEMINVWVGSILNAKLDTRINYVANVIKMLLTDFNMEE